MPMKHLSGPPVAYEVEIPGWIVALYADVAPLLPALAGVGVGLIALGGQAIVRHRRAHREAERAPAGADN